MKTAMAQFDRTIRLITVFRNLLVDIRLMIWERALPGPVVINIHQRKLKKTVEEWEEENNMRWSSRPDWEEDWQALNIPNDLFRYCWQQSAFLASRAGPWLVSHRR